MKVTNQDIINMYNSLDSFGDKEMPILITYKIVNNIDKLLKAYQVYERAREKAKTDEDIKKLLDLEVDVELETFDKNELIEAGIKLSPIQLVGMRKIIYG